MKKLGYKKIISIVLVFLFFFSILFSICSFPPIPSPAQAFVGDIAFDKHNQVDTVNVQWKAISITTTGNNSLIIVDIVSGGKTVVSVTSSPTLSFALRASINNGYYTLYRYYAIWTSSGTNDINVTTSLDYNYFGFTVYDILNANTTSPFDGSPSITSGTSSNPVYASITTTNANDILIALANSQSNSLPAVSPFTSIAQLSSYDYLTSEYYKVSSTETYQANFTSVSSNWAEMLDAVKQNGTATVTPYLIVPADFANLQTAINSLSTSGGTILVKGTYMVNPIDSDIVVKSNVTIEGQGMNQTIIRWNAGSNKGFFASSGNVSNFVLQDLTVDRGDGFDLGGMNHNITIQRCKFNETVGVTYRSTNVGLIKNNIILNSVTSICISPPPYLCYDITISGNTIINATGDTILLGSCTVTNSIIENNTVLGAGDTAIDVTAGSSYSPDYNVSVINNNFLGGMRISHADLINVTGNSIDGRISADAGQGYVNNLVICSNNFTDSDIDVALQDVTNGTIENNIFNGFSEYGVTGGAWNICIIHNNIFYTLEPTAIYGIDISTSAHITDNGLNINNTLLGNNAISISYYDTPNGTIMSGNYAYYPSGSVISNNISVDASGMYDVNDLNLTPTVSITTTANYELLILDTQCLTNHIKSVTSSPSLTWVKRASADSYDYFGTDNCTRFYAQWSSHGSITVTVNLNGTGVADEAVFYAIMNYDNTTGIFDGSSVIGSGTANASLTTSNANDMLITMGGMDRHNLEYLSSPWFLIYNTWRSGEMGSYYQTVSSTRNYNATWTTWVNGIIMDAIQQSPLTTTTIITLPITTTTFTTTSTRTSTSTSTTSISTSTKTSSIKTSTPTTILTGVLLSSPTIFAYGIGTAISVTSLILLTTGKKEKK
ncbi:MAG: right-handed parallel beta-helix repeat-containing protein [Nitrososphaeria archaeon]|jgi:hypothetical protein